MKINGNCLTLESAEEAQAFREMVDFARSLNDAQKVRAQKVFDAFVSGNEPVNIDDPSDDGSMAAIDWAANMDAAIDSKLDHRSIGHFVELIVAHRESALQAARAQARHTETRAMKSEVFQWLDANFYGNFKSMEAAAEAIAGKVVPIKFRTVRDWVGEWKKLRSAGTP